MGLQWPSCKRHMNERCFCPRASAICRRNCRFALQHSRSHGTMGSNGTQAATEQAASSNLRESELAMSLQQTQVRCRCPCSSCLTLDTLTNAHGSLKPLRGTRSFTRTWNSCVWKPSMRSDQPWASCSGRMKSSGSSCSSSSSSSSKMKSVSSS